MKNNELLLVVAAVALLTFVLLTTPRDVEPVAAADFTLESLDGVETTLSAFRGQVVILDFWASWCKPCTRTFPEVDALAERLRDEGVVLLVVSLDKDANTARTYLQENGFSTDNVLYGSLEEAREVKGLYGVVGIPHTFLIDRDGLIRFSGYPNGLTEELIRAWL